MYIPEVNMCIHLKLACPNFRVYSIERCQRSWESKICTCLNHRTGAWDLRECASAPQRCSVIFAMIPQQVIQTYSVLRTEIVGLRALLLSRSMSTTLYNHKQTNKQSFPSFPAMSRSTKFCPGRCLSQLAFCQPVTS